MASGSVPQAPREPLRRPRNPPPTTPFPRRRKTLHLLLIFVTLVLVLDALVGEKGLLETIRARRQHRELTASIERLRSENAQLREDARRLLEDPRQSNPSPARSSVSSVPARCSSSSRTPNRRTRASRHLHTFAPRRVLSVAQMVPDRPATAAPEPCAPRPVHGCPSHSRLDTPTSANRASR